MDLTFQDPIQYCFLQHWTSLPSPVTSTTGHCFALVQPLHSLWSYFSTLVQKHIVYLPAGAFIFQCHLLLPLHIILFAPSERLWQVWGFILSTSLPLLPPCWGFPFAFGRGLSFLGRSQHSPADGCSADSRNFGVLAGADEHTSFCSTILFQSNP